MNQFQKFLSSLQRGRVAAVDAARSFLGYAKHKHRDAERSDAERSDYSATLEKLLQKRLDDGGLDDGGVQGNGGGVQGNDPFLWTQKGVVDWTMVCCPDNKIRVFKEGLKKIPPGSLTYWVKIQQFKK